MLNKGQRRSGFGFVFVLGCLVPWLGGQTSFQWARGDWGAERRHDCAELDGLSFNTRQKELRCALYPKRKKAAESNIPVNWYPFNFLVGGGSVVMLMLCSRCKSFHRRRPWMEMCQIGSTDVSASITRAMFSFLWWCDAAVACHVQSGSRGICSLGAWVCQTQCLHHVPRCMWARCVFTRT